MTEQEALAALRGDDVAEAARAANVLWQMWHRCGDARLDGLLREGIEATERQDLVAADATFHPPDRGGTRLRRGLEQAGDRSLHGR
jgi:hypothetical protein